ncbi:MAG: ZIP family metal transporter [Bellilinea sp.]
MDMDKSTSRLTWRMPSWLLSLFPLVLLGLLAWVFSLTNPLGLFTANVPPIEQISVERVLVTQDGFDLRLLNSGPEPVKISQVMVDDAYWQFTQDPPGSLPRLGRATLSIPYQWVENDLYNIRLISSTGLTFDAQVPIATQTPVPGGREFLAYGLLGVYIGIIPVGIGLLWYPAMRRMDQRWLGAILALTVGLLVFLLVDTLLEVIEIGSTLPGVFQGVPLALFAALISWLGIVALSSLRKKGSSQAKARSRFSLAFLIAASIGLHNLGEGLSVGAAFSLGEAALGTFLVVGFILHNVTEGIGIAAPLLPANTSEADNTERSTPGLGSFLLLLLVSGGPAILGAWLGGFAYSPVLSTLFLGIGLGAIWQVIVEVVGLLRRSAAAAKSSWVNALNLGGFTSGIAIMYLTAFLVKF